jgi:hypothetical protein
VTVRNSDHGRLRRLTNPRAREDRGQQASRPHTGSAPLPITQLDQCVYAALPAQPDCPPELSPAGPAGTRQQSPHCLHKCKWAARGGLWNAQRVARGLHATWQLSNSPSNAGGTPTSNTPAARPHEGPHLCSGRLPPPAPAAP